MAQISQWNYHSIAYGRRLTVRIVNPDGTLFGNAGETVAIAGSSRLPTIEYQRHFSDGAYWFNEGIDTANAPIRVRLQDSLFYVQSLPIQVIATNGTGQTMKLNLYASLDSVQFQEGEYEVPWEYEHLFSFKCHNEVRLQNRDLALFRVLPRTGFADLPDYSYLRSPLWRPTILSKDGDSLMYRIKMAQSRNRFPANLYALQAQIGLPKSGHDITTYVVSHDGGRHFLVGTSSRGEETPCLLGSEFNPALFISSLHGWAYGPNFAEQNDGPWYRTTDGGMTWIGDEDFNARRLRKVSFYNDRQGWGLGQAFSEESNRIVETLYKLDDYGATLIKIPFNLEKAAFPGTNSNISDIISLNADAALITTNGFWGGQILKEGEEYRFEYLRYRIRDVERVNDSVAWMVGSRDFDAEYNYSTVFRTTNGGKKWEPLLTTPGSFYGGYDYADRPFKEVEFFDENRGIILSPSYLLLTDDGGKSWRYIPLWKSDPAIRHRYFAMLNLFDAFFVGNNLFRGVTPEGMIDIRLDGLTPLSLAVKGKEDRNSSGRSDTTQKPDIR